MLDLLNYTDRFPKLQHSARKLPVSADRFIDAPVEDFKEPLLVHLGFQPVGGSVVIAAKFFIYGMAAQDASLIHIIGPCACGTEFTIELLGQAKHHQRVQL